MANLLILESNDGDSFDELAGDTAATLSFVAALRSFMLSIVMELAVERRGNVVGNVICFPEDENVSNATGSYWSFSAQSRVWQEHIMQAVM